MSLDKNTILDVTGGDTVKDPKMSRGTPWMSPVLPKTGTTTLTLKPKKTEKPEMPSSTDLLTPIPPLVKTAEKKPDLVGSVLLTKGISAMAEGDLDTLTEAAINAAAVDEARNISKKLEQRVTKADLAGEELDVVAALRNINFLDKIAEGGFDAAAPILGGASLYAGAGHILSKTPKVNPGISNFIQFVLNRDAKSAISAATPGNIPPVSTPQWMPDFLKNISSQGSNMRKYGIPALGIAGTGLIGTGLYNAGKNYGGMDMNPVAAAGLAATGTGVGMYGLNALAKNIGENTSGLTALKELPGRLSAAVAGSAPAAGKNFDPRKFRRVASDAVKRVLSSGAHRPNLRNPAALAIGGLAAAGLGAYGLGSSGKEASLRSRIRFLTDKKAEEGSYGSTLGLAGTLGTAGTAGYLNRSKILPLLTRHPGRGAAAIGLAGTGIGTLAALSAGEISDHPAVEMLRRNPVSTGLGLTSLGAGATHIIKSFASEESRTLPEALTKHLNSLGVDLNKVKSLAGKAYKPTPLMKNIGRLGIGTGAAAMLGFALSESARKKNSHAMDYTAMINRTVLPDQHRNLPYVNPLAAGLVAAPLAGGAHALADWAATGELKWSPKYLGTGGAAGITAPVAAAAYNAMTANYSRVPQYRS